MPKNARKNVAVSLWVMVDCAFSQFLAALPKYISFVFTLWFSHSCVCRAFNGLLVVWGRNIICKSVINYQGKWRQSCNWKMQKFRNYGHLMLARFLFRMNFWSLNVNFYVEKLKESLVILLL